MNTYEMDRLTLLDELDTNAETGIKSETITARRQQYGKNQFEEQKGEHIGGMILHNLGEVTTIILLIAAALSLIMGIFHGEGYVEFVVITAIIILNMFLSISQEKSAEKSLAALRELNSPVSLVIRDGLQQEIDSAELTPGDILLLKTGDLISADGRLLESADLAVDESALTGESLPAEKDAGACQEGAVAVADQACMIFAGCLVTAGRGRAVVTQIGMNTQMGHIAGYLNNSQKLKTPLQNRIDNVGQIISLVAVFAALIILGLGYLRGLEMWDMVFVAIALAVAAVPETLALMVTLSLSHGVMEMVKKNALIRKLPAVETLGGTSVICTDKTGTLTQNRMTVERLWIEQGEPFEAGADFTPAQQEFLNRFALVVNATAETQPDGSVKVLGTPTEAAIIRLFLDKNGDKDKLEKEYPRVAEISFSSARKMSSVVLKNPGGGYLALTCGAFDRVPFRDLTGAGAPGAADLEAAKERMDKRHRVHDDFAHDSYRMFALGSKRLEELPEADKLYEVESDLDFEGIVGIIDPPRPECAEAIAKARSAGVRTVMITGDHAVTAAAIARQIGLFTEGDKVLTGVELAAKSDEELVEDIARYSVFARVSPEDKIRIVEAWQEHDEVVTMTGDGVNDAPALKAADVGVAMGLAGTDVAKSAADMVLTDDNFSTIVEAIHTGRDVFSNIRKKIYFLFVCNFSEIIIMLGAMLIGWGMPLTPIMLLLINVLGDGVPGLALATEKSDPRIMQRHPIGRNESLFSGLYIVIAKQIVAFVSVVMATYYLGATSDLAAGTIADLSRTSPTGQTMTFLVMGWMAIMHVFTVRSRQSIFKRGVLDNPRLTVSAASMIILFALLALVSPLANVFGLVAISANQWLTVIGLALIPTATAEIGKLIQNHNETRTHRRRIVRHYQKDIA